MSAQSRTVGDDLRRVLTKWDVVALIVGIIIGSGIFATPPQVAQSLDRFGPMMSVWIIGGLLALCGALTYAELSALFPRTGGTYVFIHEVYGSGPAFVYGWSAMLITYPASIAAVSMVFAAYLSRLVPDVAGIQPIVAALLALSVCGLNMLGVILGARVQRTFTAAKVAALGALVFFAAIATSGRWDNLAGVFSSPSGGWSASAWALGMAAVIWTIEGWNDAPTVAGEVKDLRHDVPQALLIGTGLVTLIYLLVNTAYVYVLGIPGIAASQSVAVDMATHAFGAHAGLFVTLLVLVSTFGSANGMAISSSRVLFALARDGLFLRTIGRAHPRFHTPAYALLVVAVVSVVYCLIGTFERVTRYVVFVMMLWYLLVTVSVFIMRRRRPAGQLPYRIPLYPLPPVLFLLVAGGLSVQLFRDNTHDATIGLVILAAAVPLYFAWRWFDRRLVRSEDAGGM